MKEPRFVQDCLRDILEAMDKAEEFTNGIDLPTFSGDDKTSKSKAQGWAGGGEEGGRNFPITKNGQAPLPNVEQVSLQNLRLCPIFRD